MFASIEEIEDALRRTGYIADPITVTTVYLAARLHKPLLLEGPAGSGKTQLAYAVAEAANSNVERLQCYEGINEEKAIGRFDEALQSLFVELKAKAGDVDWDDYEIPDKSEGKWIKTNPKIHADKAIQAQEAYNSEWKGLVRMLKYLNNHHDKPIKPSFLIEVMALECLHPPFGGRFDYEFQGIFSSQAILLRMSRSACSPKKASP